MIDFRLPFFGLLFLDCSEYKLSLIEFFIEPTFTNKSDRIQDKDL